MEELTVKTCDLIDCILSGGCPAGFKYIDAGPWEKADGFDYRIVVLVRLSDNSLWVYSETRTGSVHDSYDYSWRSDEFSTVVRVSVNPIQ